MSLIETSKAAGYASQSDKAAQRAFGYLEQTLAALRRTNDVKVQVAALLTQLHISFRWVGTRLDLMGPDGNWVEGPDLQGSVRSDGTVTAGHLVRFKDGSGDIVEDAGPAAASSLSFAPAGALEALTVQAALLELEAEKAPRQSPDLLGEPTADTPTAGDNSRRLSTTAFVKQAIDNLIAASPAALDTLNELAAALGDDANFAATIATQMGLKANTSDVATALGLKADASAMTTALGLKANQATTYTKSETDLAIVAATAGGVGITSGTSLTLTAASQKFQNFNPTVAGAPITLPNATTLTVGTVFRFYNPSLLSAHVLNGANVKMATVAPGDTVVATLGTNSSAAGTWYFFSRVEQPLTFLSADNIFNPNLTSFEVAVISPTSLLIAYNEVTTDILKAVVATISGQTISSLGTPTSIRTGAAAAPNAFAIQVMSATVAVLHCSHDGSAFLRTLGISGTTISALTEYHTISGVAVIGYNNTCVITPLTSTTFVLTTKGSYQSTVFAISGSTFTSGSAGSWTTPAAMVTISVAKLSSTAVLFSGRNGTTIYYVIATISGTAISYGTTLADGTGWEPVICLLSPTSFLVADRYSASSIQYLGIYRYTISGTTISLAESSRRTLSSSYLSLHFVKLDSSRALLADEENGVRVVYVSPFRIGPAGPKLAVGYLPRSVELSSGVNVLMALDVANTLSGIHAQFVEGTP